MSLSRIIHHSHSHSFTRLKHIPSHSFHADCSSITKKVGFTELVFQLELGVFFNRSYCCCGNELYIYKKKMIMTCSQLFWHVSDTIIVVSSDKEWFFWSFEV